MERYIKEREVAETTSRSLSTLRNERSRGVGIPYIKIGRSVRYSSSDVREYMEARKIKTVEH